MQVSLYFNYSSIFGLFLKFMCVEYV